MYVTLSSMPEYGISCEQPDFIAHASYQSCDDAVVAVIES